MNKKITFLLLFFLLSVGFLWKVPKTDAASFTNAYIRLDNQTANAALSGTICAQPSNAGANNEAKVLINFPSDFSISANSGNWTTNVSNLPNGASNWPGISSVATTVSSRTVTFGSGDLTANIVYCFNFAGSASTTGNSGTDKAGTITTKNSSNTNIDSTNYALAILAHNQAQVTATVPPNITYLPISVESTTAGNNFPQNTVLNYKITYGLLTVGDFPLTIQAQWSQGTVNGSLGPSVDVVGYAIGSASNGYGRTVPIVDTVNKTITWTFNSFPGNTTNKTLTFQLKTNDYYTGNSNVSFDVSARAISKPTITPDQTVTQTYSYSANLGPTPNPTQTPTVTPTLTTTAAVTTKNNPTPTLTPTPPAPPTISAIDIQSISQSNAKITIDTSSKSTFTVKYGTAQGLLSQNLTSLTPLASNTISLPDLIPDTNYYFKVVAKDPSGAITSSDIFTFRTAVISEAPTADTQTLIATSNNNIINSPQAADASGNKTGNAAIVVPVASTFSIQFALNKTTVIKSIQAFIVNKHVLAANTFAATSANPNYVNLVEIQPGVYTGKLLSQPDSGNYELYTRIIDYNGNITVQKIADLNIVDKFIVITKGTKAPTENARVLLYLYNPQLRTYTVISPSILPITNPSFSATDGTINITLPQGRYKAEISAIGYKNKTVEFAITSQGGYPTVALVPNTSIISFAQYYLSTLSDALISSQIYLQQEAKSSRLFDLTTIGAFIFLTGTTILSISARTHIAVLYIPYFLYFKFLFLFRKNTNRIILGRVIDEQTGDSISRAIVYLSDPKGQHVLTSLITNKLGEFYYNNPKGLDYKITVMKEGYRLSEPWEFVNNKVKAIPTILKMQFQEKPHYSILKIAAIYIEDFIGIWMEFLILFGLLTQIYFISTFGFIKVAPFICITILNILLIFTFLYKPGRISDYFEETKS
jgi:hypothetical protein